MMRPALGYISLTGAVAVLKRAVVIFSKKFIYFCLPSQQVMSVKRTCGTKPDTLKNPCKPVLKNFLEGGPASASRPRSPAHPLYMCAPKPLRFSAVSVLVHLHNPCPVCRLRHFRKAEDNDFRRSPRTGVLGLQMSVADLRSTWALV